MARNLGAYGAGDPLLRGNQVKKGGIRWRFPRCTKQLEKCRQPFSAETVAAQTLHKAFSW